ncbi:myb-like protein X [Silurus asotus]|uniref:Myb-like protein X n=1 Tax=Silurus asotus TaxID=30991 RepID=A0AAD5FRA0_SILAS|nr:myb-like protein X [Silurus asotus]
MAATEANTEPLQVEAGETKAEEEPSNSESSPVPTEETNPTTDATQTTEPSADKVKPASENIWDSFLNKSGLGKVMGGKKKKEHSTLAEEGLAEDPDKSSATNKNDQIEEVDLKDQSTSQPASETATDGQVIEKVPENEEAVQEQKVSSAKPKHGEKSSVRDLIRKPVAKIFSHKSTEKKEGSGELSKHGKVRSKSLDRLENADASAVVIDQNEDPKSTEEADKSTSQTAKPMKRWHSFKKLMVQKSHKKSTDEPRDAEGAEGVSADAAGDTETLDSTIKSEHTGQKRWKLKRSWTFQGLKRDTSLAVIHKPKDKDSSDNLKDENTPEADQGATQISEESKESGDAETQVKTHDDGEEEKEAPAAAAAAAATATTHTKNVDQHANDIWTSFKNRVIHKSKKAADPGGEEEEPIGEQEQTEEQQASKDSSKSAKSKRTHFNRAVSLKNFIMRKGKSTSMDMGDGSAVQKENKEESKDTDGSADTTGAADLTQCGSEDQAAITSERNNGAQVGDEHKSSDVEEKSLPSIPSGEQSDTPHLSSEERDQAEPNVEPETNGENGCSGAATEDPIAQNNEPPVQVDVVKKEETNQEDTNSDKTCAKDGKILNQDGNCGTGNAVAESGEFDAAIDSNNKAESGKTDSIVGLGANNELETEVCCSPGNGGSFIESSKNNDQPDDQNETLKRMFYQDATSIVQTVLQAATEQLVKEKNFLDSSQEFSQTNHDNFTDVDVGFCH